MPYTNEQPEAKRWRPFLRLAMYLPEDFIKIAEEWLFLVSTYGISKTPMQPTTKDEWIAFFAHCHDGWKRAQTEIAAFLTEALARRTQAQEREMKLRQLRNKEGQKRARAEAKQISLEITFARRMLDVILWTIFAGEHSTLRRLIVEGGEHNFSAENIVVGMRAADSFNEDPHIMALCTDMLSLVHVGDLILANRIDRSIKFVELTAGDKNAEIAAVAEFAVRTDCKLFEAIATAEYDDTDRKHYERVKKQTKRNEMVVSTIRNEGGTDPNTGNRVVIHTTPDSPEYWTDRIQQCYENMTDDKKWAIDVIDECVYLGVYNDQAMAFAGFNAWMEREGCESQIFNLMDSFHDLGVRPLGATLLMPDLRRKILRGEILVIMCLDISKFIELGNSMRPDYLRLATKAETGKMRSHRLGSFTLNGRYIRATIEGETMFMGTGTRDRILFDQHLPSQLLAQRLATGPMSQYVKPKSK